MSYVNLLDILYPIGSVYLSIVNNSPSNFIGGTWQKIEDAALRCGTANINTYIGSDTHTLTIAEMPSHQYSLRGVNSAAGVSTKNGLYSIDIYEDVADNWWVSDNLQKATGGGNPTQLYNILTIFLDGYESPKTKDGDF